MPFEIAYVIFCIVIIVLIFVPWIYLSIKADRKICCSICGFQPHSGYYWIKNQRYCDDCFKTYRECKLNTEETNYKILMRIQESRKRTLDESKKLITENKDNEYDWLKKKGNK